MGKTPQEAAQDHLRRNNDKTVETSTGVSPSSRASVRQAKLLTKEGTAESLSKSTSVEAGKRSQGSKKRSPNAKRVKQGSLTTDVVEVVPVASNVAEKSTSPKGVRTEATVSSHKQKPKRYPDYSGCVVSYTCPESNRPGHGIVGKCNHAEGTYEVTFTFTDNQKPKGTTDSCVPLQFVEENMVDDETALAWTTAVANHLLIDSPTSKTTEKRMHLRTTNKASKAPATNPKKPLRINESQVDEGHDITPSKSGSKRKRKSSVLVDPGIQAMLIHHVREATYDIRPSVTRLRPFMYWAPNKETACAKMLIKRTPALRVMAEGQRRNEFARLIAGTLKGYANNERSAQVRQIKTIYLDDKSDFALVSDYVIGASANGALKNMRIGNALREEFNDIDELRNALHSPTMYTYEKLFDLFCAALESERFRGTEQMPISPIENLITVAHEAQFRLELWYALQTQSFRHDTAKSAQEERKENHTNLCKLVAQDRRENATLANSHRNTSRASNCDDSDTSEDDSDEGLDSQYF